MPPEPKDSAKPSKGKTVATLLPGAVSRPFPKPSTGRIAVKVIDHLGDEVMKVFPVPGPLAAE